MESLIVLVLAVIAYYFIIFVKDYEKSVTTLIFAITIMALRLIPEMTPERLGEMVDFNTLGLLLGMMIIVGFLKKSGFFQYSIIKILRMSGGKFSRTMLMLMGGVAVTSAFLDNVITIMMTLPMIFVIADTMEIDPTPLVFLTIFIDNVGGMATLIGSPLNLVLGSISGKSFNDFLFNTGLFAIPAFVVIYWMFSRRIKITAQEEKKLKKLVDIDPEKAIEDRKLMRISTVVFSLVVFGFIMHSFIHLELSYVSLLGALSLLFITRKSFEKVSEDIDWDTLFFYMGLYLISYALEEIGVIKAIASVLFPFKGFPLLTSMIVLWGSAFVIPFLSAVPGTLILAPVIRYLVVNGFSPNLWWAYAFGANLGTNFTPLGAVQNLVGVSMLEKQTGRRIGFSEFMKVGIPVTLPALILGSLWIVLFYRG